MTERDDMPLSDRFAKDAEDEQFLARLNTILEPFEHEEYRDLSETYPTLYVVGAPRSGTTLLSQVLCSHLDVSYVSNLSAAFWKAPVYGLKLARKLQPHALASSFQSDFGRTTGLYEPHEFGYFWSQQLGYPDMQQREASFEEQIDWAILRTTLNNMTHAVGKAMVFKPFLLAFHLARMSRVMEKSIFVRVRRDPVDTALSILKMRRQYAGSEDHWVSLKPLEYDWLKTRPNWYQAVGQVFFLEELMSAQLASLPPHRYLDVRYEAFCQNPVGTLRNIRTRLAEQGGDVSLHDSPGAFDVSRPTELHNNAEVANVRAAVRELYGA